MIFYLLYIFRRPTTQTQYDIFDRVFLWTTWAMVPLVHQVIWMTEGQEKILAKFVVNSMKAERPSLDQKTRHTLENLNLATYPPTHRSLNGELLQNTLGWSLRFSRNQRMQSKRTRSFAVLVNIPNLFHGFQHLQEYHWSRRAYIIDRSSLCMQQLHFLWLDIWMVDWQGCDLGKTWDSGLIIRVTSTTGREDTNRSIYSW